MKILVTGASGYLGRRIVAHISESTGSGHLPVSAYNRGTGGDLGGRPWHLDLRSVDAPSRIVDLGPDAIIHCAAVNPGGPESAMEQVNVEGSRRVAEAARLLGARLVHVSTDVVHDGLAAPYADDAMPSPVGTYGVTKAGAEAAVRESCPRATVVRTSLIYGLDAMDHGTRGFAERLRAGGEVGLFADVLRQPVWVETLARALVRLAELAPGGFVNVAGSQVLSRDAFGRRMLKAWGVEGRGRVKTVLAREVAPAVPRDLRLRLDRARKLLDIDLPGVDEVLTARAGSDVA
ncbi:MAG: sugar nucleotide-binding protein [Acidobacteriota bacterium]